MKVQASEVKVGDLVIPPWTPREQRRVVYVKPNRYSKISIYLKHGGLFAVDPDALVEVVT